MHRDLKPDNILLGDKGSIKICDFGLAREAGTDLRKTGKQGTPLYAAPEVYLNKEEKYDERIDVWSCGLILYEMLKGKTAFNHIKVFFL
jgi:serine/threonine protein kinase